MYEEGIGTYIIKTLLALIGEQKSTFALSDSAALFVWLSQPSIASHFFSPLCFPVMRPTGARKQH